VVLLFFEMNDCRYRLLLFVRRGAQNHCIAHGDGGISGIGIAWSIGRAEICIVILA
jgi:hypothetical protein